MTDPRADVREVALAKVRRLDAARKTLAALTLDECQLLYVEMEERLKGASSDSAPTASTPRPKRKHCRQPPRLKWTDRVEQLVRDNPQGLRCKEIAQLTGQTQPNAFGVLKQLERYGRVERHGRSLDTLWTAPGVTPKPRIETIPAAIMRTLSLASKPMDARELRAGVQRLLEESIGRTLRTKTISGQINNLLAEGLVVSVGANERGPTYALGGWKGAIDTTTLN